MHLPSLEKLHHAYVITGNRQANLDLIKKYLEENKISVTGNPDLYIFDQEVLKIDQLREEIISFLSNQKLSSSRFVIISVDQIGTEAQNAFLKNLEEPANGTHIFILIKDEKKLLSTILSRAQLIQGENTDGETRLDINEFIKMNLAARYEYIETWTKAKKDEDNVSKTEIINFIDQLEKFLWQEFKKPLPSPLLQGEGAEQLFADIRKMREYASIRGASHRVILDFLAMVVPAKV